MSYDFTMTSKDFVMSGKMWVQGEQVKTEMTTQGQKIITFIDGKSIVSYNPAEKTAFKITPEKGKEQMVERPLDYSGNIHDKPEKIKIIDSVIYDGVKCKVIEVVSADGKEHSKMWLREDYGIPVKVEVT